MRYETVVVKCDATGCQSTTELVDGYGTDLVDEGWTVITLQTVGQDAVGVEFCPYHSREVLKSLPITKYRMVDEAVTE